MMEPARSSPTLIGDARRLFRGAGESVYFDVGARGLMPETSRAAIDQHLDELMAGRADKAAMFAATERVRAKFARLIHAEPDEVALVKNMSDGVCTLAAAFEFAPGDEVLLCADLEHPNNIYPWLNLRDRLGIKVRSIPSENDQIPVEAMIASMTQRTRLVTVSTNTFSPGLRTDLAPLGAACRARGIFLLADAAQSVGVLRDDVGQLKIDGLVCAAQKALLGLYGLGFLYVRREWAERMRPAGLVRFGVDLGQGHEADIGQGEIRLKPGARRFEVGNYNFPALIGLEPCLDLFHALGPGTIESHACGLARQLAEGLRALGLPVAGGPDFTHLAHIVCIGHHSPMHDATGDATTGALHAALVEAGVKHSLRGGMIRLGLHLYNDQQDVERTLDAARRFTQAAPAIPVPHS